MILIIYSLLAKLDEENHSLLLHGSEINAEEIFERMKTGQKFSTIVGPELISKLGPIAQEFARIIDSIVVSEESCYSRVVKQLNIHCDEANENERTKLAIKFTLCYLNATGKESYYSEDVSEEGLLKNWPHEKYKIYVRLKSHWNDLCHFARQSIFNEYTSQSLVFLFKSVIETTNSIYEVEQELKNSTATLDLLVNNIQTQLLNGSFKLDFLNQMVNNFTKDFTPVTGFVDSVIQQVNRFKMYGFVLIASFILAAFLPEILIPVVLVTLVLFFGEKALSKRLGWWDNSSIRIWFRILYLIICFSYPVFKLSSRVVDCAVFFSNKETKSSKIRIPRIGPSKLKPPPNRPRAF